MTPHARPPQRQAGPAVTELPKTRPDARRTPSDRPGSGRRSRPPAPSADIILFAVIAACFLPIGLLVIAAYGGGLTAVALAFVAEALLTAALVTMIARAIDRGH